MCRPSDVTNESNDRPSPSLPAAHDRIAAQDVHLLLFGRCWKSDPPLRPRSALRSLAAHIAGPSAPTSARIGHADGARPSCRTTARGSIGRSRIERVGPNLPDHQMADFRRSRVSSKRASISALPRVDAAVDDCEVVSRKMAAQLDFQPARITGRRRTRTGAGGRGRTDRHDLDRLAGGEPQSNTRKRQIKARRARMTRRISALAAASCGNASVRSLASMGAWRQCGQTGKNERCPGNQASEARTTIVQHCSEGLTSLGFLIAQP